jgi:DNA invertase Pin-like site-specific DNA recombinase
MTATAVAYYRTSSATNVGQVGNRQKTPPDPPFMADGSSDRPVLSAESAPASSGELYSDKDSLIRQQQAVRACAQSRGLHIVREFYDAAVSGADPVNERPQFREMMQYINFNGARTIIVENASRFARDHIVQETGYQMLKAKGIELIAADSPDMFLLDTPTAKFIRVVLSAVWELDKTMLVEKLRAARDRKSAKLGERIEGSKAWKALRNPVAITMAKEAAKRGLSLRAIAAELAQLRLVAKSGKPYGPQSIKRMLRQP